MIWVTCGGYLEAKEEDRKEPSREQLESVVRAANAIRALAKLKFPVTASRVSMLVQVNQLVRAVLAKSSSAVQLQHLVCQPHLWMTKFLLRYLAKGKAVLFKKSKRPRITEGR